MAKHKVYKTNPLRKYIIISLFIFLFIGIGYSVLSTSLDLNGTISISKYDKTLYGVFEKEAKKGTYVKEYTGDHHDSFIEEPSKKIYSWYSTSSNMSTNIKSKNNVIFGNQCWRMYRTTDTGGVKMIYYGEVENNMCSNSRTTHVSFGTENYVGTESKMTLSTDYYYGDDFIYNSSEKTFSLTGNVFQTAVNETTFPLVKRKYTCKSNSITGTCSILYVVKSYVSESVVKVLSISNKQRFHGIGIVEYNSDDHATNNVSYSLAFFGYMYKKAEGFGRKQVGSSNTTAYRNTLGTSYWYADSISWDSDTNKWSLVDPYKVTSSSDYASLVGKYTFRNSTETYTNSTVQYISAVKSNNYYYVSLSSGNTDLNTYKKTYIYGDSYVENGDGTYSIPNYNIIDSYSWPNDYNLANQKYFCMPNTENKCENLYFTATVSDTSYAGNSPNNKYRYASSAIYENGKYKLSSDSMVFWETGKTENTEYINSHHYTCWDESDECVDVSFINGGSTRGTFRYSVFSEGRTIDDYMSDMLYADDVNQNDSTIKFAIDTWYSHYLKDYSNYIEDTIYCNDRLISNYGGFSETGNIEGKLSFSNMFRCPNVTDQFSVANEKAKLTYPVGTLTYSEYRMVGNGSLFSVESVTASEDFYTMTPTYHDGDVALIRILHGGGSEKVYAYARLYVRPVISLKPGIEYISGNGSMNKPYVIDAPPIGS